MTTLLLIAPIALLVGLALLPDVLLLISTMRLLGSSEVLESIIGKFKCVAGERGQHGLTGMVLSIGALVGRVTVAAVQDALADISNQDVWNWCKTNLGTTVQSLRCRIALALGAEQKRQPLRIGKT